MTELEKKRREWLSDQGYTDSQIDDIIECDGKEEVLDF